MMYTMGSRMRKREMSMSKMKRKLVRAALKAPRLSGTRLYIRLYCRVHTNNRVLRISVTTLICTLTPLTFLT